MAAAARKVTAAPKVLVVEDEHQVCELMSDALETAGVDVDCVQSDREAYRYLGKGRNYVALLVDINLGHGTTGFDVARFARQVDTEIAVIYVSGHSSEGSFKAFGVPGSTFLAKPFTSDELLDRVRQVIGDNDR
jgi:two-component system, cell cycle response regulator CpdR